MRHGSQKGEDGSQKGKEKEKKEKRKEKEKKETKQTKPAVPSKFLRFLKKEPPKEAAPAEEEAELAEPAEEEAEQAEPAVRPEQALEAISCSRVVVEPVSSGTYEPSSKLNLKVLQNILKGVYKIQKNEERAREREEEEEQAAQNISNLLADDMELDFDDDNVPVWRSIVNKYREGDQVLRGEAVKITHLYKDKKDNEKATEFFSSEPAVRPEQAEPAVRPGEAEAEIAEGALEGFIYISNVYFKL